MVSSDPDARSQGPEDPQGSQSTPTPAGSEGGDPPAEAGPPEDEAALAPQCVRAEKRMLEFLAGGQRRAEHAALREHLAACVRCNEEYRRQAVFVAQIGRGKRRRGGADRAPGAAGSIEALAGSGSADGSRAARVGRVATLRSAPAPLAGRTGIRLRTLLLPAFVIFLMTQVNGLRDRARGFEVTALAGHVAVGDRALAVFEPELELAPGALCATSLDGRALIRRGPTRLFVDGGSEVVLESEDERRVHIGLGTLVAHGPCSVVTEDGLVDVPPEAVCRIVSGPQRTEVEVLAGSVALENAAERREVQRGERAAFAR